MSNVGTTGYSENKWNYFNPTSIEFKRAKEDFHELAGWKKVLVVVASFFAAIPIPVIGGFAAFCFTVKMLNGSEKKLFNKYSQLFLPPKDPPQKIEPKTQSTKSVGKSQPNLPPDKLSEEAGVLIGLEEQSKNGSIEAFRQTGKELLTKTVDLYYQKGIEPNLADSSVINPLFEYVKSKIEVVTEIKQDDVNNTISFYDQSIGLLTTHAKLFSPLRNTLDDVKASQLISGESQPQLDKLINWALGSIDELPDEKLKQDLTEHFKNNPCGTSVVIWLYGNRAESLVEACAPHEHKAIVAAFKNAICFLVLKQLTNFSEGMKALNAKTIENLFKINAKKLGEKTLDQAIHLIEHLDYPEMFEKLLRVLLDQSQAIADTSQVEADAIRAERMAIAEMKQILQTVVALEAKAIKNVGVNIQEATQQLEGFIQKALNLVDDTNPFTPGSKRYERREILLAFKKNNKDMLSQEGGKEKFITEKIEEAKKQAFLNANTPGRDAWRKLHSKSQHEAYEIFKKSPDQWLQEVSTAANKRMYFAHLNEQPFLKEFISEEIQKHGLHSDEEKGRVRQKVKEDLYKSAMEDHDENGHLQKIGKAATRASYKMRESCHPKIDTVRPSESLSIPQEADSSPIPQEIHRIFHVLDQSFQIFTKFLKKIEKKEQLPYDFFAESAEKTLDLLTPKEIIQIKQDSVDKNLEVEGLLSLIDQLEYPAELTELYKKGLFIYQNIVLDENKQMITNHLEKFQEPIKALENFLIFYVKDVLQAKVTDVLIKQFKELTVPENVNTLMVKTVLPAMQAQLLASLARQLLAAKTEVYGPLFAAFYEVEEGNLVQTELFSTLKEDVRNALNQAAGDTVADNFLEETLTPLIVKISEALADLDGQGNYAQSLKTYLGKVEEVGDNSIYGDLAINLIFNIGQLSSTAASLSGFFKGMLSQQITAAMSKIQESPNYLVDQVNEKLKKDYLSDNSEAAIAQLLGFEKADPLPKVSPEEVQHEITRTAKITHDLFTQIVTQQTWIVRRSMKFVIGSDFSHLNSVLTRIYDQVINDRLKMENLVMQVQETVFDALEQSAKQIEANKEPRTVDRSPSLLSGFLRGVDLANIASPKAR